VIHVFLAKKYIKEKCPHLFTFNNSSHGIKEDEKTRAVAAVVVKR